MEKVNVNVNYPFNVFEKIVLNSPWVARSIESLGHGKRFRIMVELELILVTLVWEFIV
jgi:hypothetical protein